MCADGAQPWNAVDNIDGQIKPIYLVEDGELKRCVDTALFLISAYMDVVMIPATVAEFVNERSIRVEIENDGFVDREERIEISVGESVWMFSVRHQTEEIDDVDEAYLKIREVFFENRDGRH